MAPKWLFFFENCIFESKIGGFYPKNYDFGTKMLLLPKTVHLNRNCSQKIGRFRLKMHGFDSKMLLFSYNNVKFQSITLLIRRYGIETVRKQEIHVVAKDTLNHRNRFFIYPQSVI